MNLREANVMRGQMSELRLKLVALETRMKMVEDALARIQERANDRRRTRSSNIESGAPSL